MGTLLRAERLMAELTEIRIDGRGGQGNVVAAYMLAQAGFEAGRFVQAFPSFGPERRGAPVAAFVRVSDRPIRRRCQISQPHYVIIQDPSLLHVAGIAQNVGPGGGVLINSSRKIEGLVHAAGVMVASLPATAMALRVLGQPIPNTALLAAFLSLSLLFPLAALERVLMQRFEGEALQRNLRLMREAAASVSPGSWKDTSRAPGN
jgi:pyruvate ferredoxin oxidoreductase gamma subunit